MENLITEINETYYNLNIKKSEYDAEIDGEDYMINKIELALGSLSIAIQELEQGLKALNNHK